MRDLDPGVVQKWAEEGFAVVSAQGKDALSDGEGLERAIMEARKWRNVDQQAGESDSIALICESLVQDMIARYPQCS